MKISVIGAGNYGTVLAKVLAEKGSHDVCIWNWEGDSAPLDAIEQSHENTVYLPGFKLPPALRVERDLETAVRSADLVVMTLPSHVCLAVAKQFIGYIQRNQTLLIASKGFCKETNSPLLLALKDMLRSPLERTLTIISGPAVAKELAAGAPTCMQVSGYHKKHISVVMAAFADTPVTLCATDDVVGISIGGSFKNVYAISLGICDGLGMSLNTKAAILVFAMEELANIADVLGGRRETVFGLSGLGDLIGTGMSEHSRNRRFGEYIAKGFSVEASRAYVGQVVEGTDAIEVLHSVAAAHNVKFHFVDQIRDILTDPSTAEEKIISFINSCSIHRV